MSIDPHLFWITSRAAGVAALLAASSSVSLGLLMGLKAKVPGRRDLRHLHEALSLCTLALALLHGVALLGDGWLDPGLSGVAVPFAGSYRPFWTGIGIVAGYGLAVLGGAYYLRNRIGAARWRRIHRLTALFWLLAVGHAIGAGSDAGQWWFLAGAGVTVLPAALLLAVRWLPGQDGPALASPQAPRRQPRSHRAAAPADLSTDSQRLPRFVR